MHEFTWGKRREEQRTQIIIQIGVAMNTERSVMPYLCKSILFLVGFMGEHVLEIGIQGQPLLTK